MSETDTARRWRSLEGLSASDPQRRAQAAADLIEEVREGLSLDHARLTARVKGEEELVKHTALQNTSAQATSLISPSNSINSISSISSTGIAFMEALLEVSATGRCSLLKAMSAMSEAELRESPWMSVVCAGLDDPTPKVRQSAAQLLSAHPLSTPEELKARLDAEEVYFVRASLLLALGRACPSEPQRALKALEMWVKKSAERGLSLGDKECSALNKARSALKALISSQDVESSPLTLTVSSPLSLAFTTPHGLESPLTHELSDLLKRGVYPQGELKALESAGLVTLTPVEPCFLSAERPCVLPRSAGELCIVIHTRPAQQGEGRASRLSALLEETQRLAQKEDEHLSALVSMLHERPLSVRLSLPLNDKRAQREALKSGRSLLSALSPHITESPSAYVAQLSARYGDTDSLVLTLPTLGAHSGYRRQQDVGASMAQEVAAAVARWSKRHANTPHTPQENTEPYTIIDPTCGSGSLLIERALLEDPQEHSAVFLGRDISDVALKASLSNLSALKQRHPQLAEWVSFERADSRASEGWRPFDEALMNLPFGLRVTGAQGRRAAQGELEDLYFKLFRQARAHAKPHAHLTCYSAQRALTERASSAMGWVVSESTQLYAGGLKVWMWCLRLR
jgi:PIN domain nuclease of toxin-antitoxin system